MAEECQRIVNRRPGTTKIEESDYCTNADSESKGAKWQGDDCVLNLCYGCGGLWADFPF